MNKIPATFDHKTFLATAPELAGVYQMFNASHEIIYVGKAKNLKKRLTSYFTKASNDKTLALVRQIANIEVIVTASEKEALFLEANLIKNHQPRYNVLLKDDKAYPYLLISNHTTYPRLDVTRSRDKAKGETFGPYMSATQVRQSIILLQKIFKLRPCHDSYFRARTRPCLQHQINRCSAPCVNLISVADYQEQLLQARKFLRGESSELIAELGRKMQEASKAMNFEAAAHLRDTLSELQKLQDVQCVDLENNNNDYDIVAAAIKAGVGCISLLVIRGGRSLGVRQYYFRDLKLATTNEELLETFLTQYYLANAHSEQLPDRLVINETLAEKDLWEETLSEASNHQVQIMTRLRQVEKQWLMMAEENVRISLATHLKKQRALSEQFASLQEALNLEKPIMRIECFDISHTQGERTVASCVVFDQSGAARKSYRLFNITDIKGGDDYAAMRQVLERRYKNLAKEDTRWPDVVLIDGGKGQLAQAIAVFASLKLQDKTPILLGVAKGPQRIEGEEDLWLPGLSSPLPIPRQSAARHLIEQVRNEAHRFAITAHKKSRGKARLTSVLETITGLGPKRRQALLLHFGGIAAIKEAAASELMKVHGISEELALRIYQKLRE